MTGDDGAVFSATVYTGIDAAENPDLKQQLLEGTLNRVESPFDDERVYEPAIPVTYHDATSELFVLVIPDERRHEEFACRMELLERMAETVGEIPRYIREFDVVFDPGEIERVERNRQREEKASAHDFPAPDRDAVFGSGDGSEEGDVGAEEIEKRAAELDERAEQIEKRAEELDERAEKLDQRQQRIEADRKQLDDVAERVDRDSARVQQTREQLDAREQELDERERKLQVRELNLEQKELRQQQQADEDEEGDPTESTQVVTEDQFIEIVEPKDDQEPEPDDGADDEIATAETTITERPPPPDGDHPAPPAGSAAARRPEPAAATIVDHDPDEVFDDFSEFAGDDRRWFVERTEDLIVVGFRVGDDTADAFEEGTAEFLFQLHEIDQIPVIAFTLAAFDDEDECLEAVAAPVVGHDDHQRAVLDEFERDIHLQLVLYGEDGEVIDAWEAGAPIRENVRWARRRLEQWHEQTDDLDSAERAAKRIADGEVELVGSMRHPFDSRSFVDFEGASDVKLAVSIVGYWSEPDQFEYLIGNRCFSLDAFRQIQRRVVRQALHWGIDPGDLLRQFAIDEAIILDDVSMVQRLLSNFAEVCVGLRPNDLDPIEQWENWEALIELAQQVDITPDPEVVELAEVSLKRAEEYAETMEGEEMPDDIGESAVLDAAADTSTRDATDVVELTVSRRDEDSGVTYFLPRDAGDDYFAQMMDADRGVVKDALGDPQRGVEAAQVILERFGDERLDEVLEAAEEMVPAERAALARFCEARADDLEAALMQRIDDLGRCGAFIAIRALAAVGSTAAIRRLIELVRQHGADAEDPELAQCLALFGDKLVPPLSKALKDDADDETLLFVLSALERARSGTMEEMADDRSEQLQEAVARAREL